MTEPFDRRALPAGATIGTWRAADGWPMRTFDWPAEGAARGAILFQGGRGDVFEKYLEAFAHWHAAGWQVTSFDWRGQGGSGRTTPAPHVGDIADFGLYIADLAGFWRGWASGTAGPRIAIGHSMGGHLLLRALAERAIDPAATVLVAPMLGLHSPAGPVFGEALANLVGRLGHVTRAAWKTNERPGTVRSRQSLLTHDPDRYADELWWQMRDPVLLTGPPSWRWLIRAFASTRRLRGSPALASVTTRLLMLVAEADGLVDPHAALDVAARLADCRVERFGAESAHEILREVDPVRNRALAAIDSFLAGP